MKYLCMLLSATAAFTLYSCGTHTGSSPFLNGSDSIKAANSTLPQGDFYKRYSGSIAGRPVVANITRFGKSVSGTYQYTGLSQVLELSPDSSSGSYFRVTEFIPGHASDVPDSAAHWEVTVTADALNGRWISAGGLRIETIRLKEEYPEGSYRLDAITRQDSAQLIAGKSEPHATASYTAIFAQGNNAAAAFINSKLREALGLPAAGDAGAVIEAALQKYLDKYRKENAFLLRESHDTTMYWSYNSSQDATLNVLVNDNSLLVVQNFISEYTGGAHGNYASSYLNLDVANSKVWKLQDVILDTSALSPLLNLAARNYFSIPQGAAMDNMMLVSEVPVTDNFFLTPEGLTFVYNPYEIAAYAEGSVQLYLSYKKLMSLLTPAFKARLHLNPTAGVALHKTRAARRTFGA